MTQNPTPKRMKEYRSRLHDAHNLERVQKALIALADAHDAGTVPAGLANLKTKDEVYLLVHKSTVGGGYYDVITATDYATKTDDARLLQAMIEQAVPAADREAKERANKLAQLEADVQFSKMPGFFPTPAGLVSLMIEEAGLAAGHRVLEPSAGKGDIAEAVRSRGAEVDVIELSCRLQEILKLRGFNLIGSDFMEEQPNGVRYDRILMNPPFEKGQDSEHIRHAYNFLADGGRLVAIASAGTFFRSDRKSAEFREWLEGRGFSQELEPGVFASKDSFRQTGCNCRLVVVNK